MHAGNLDLWLVHLGDLLDQLGPRLAAARAGAVHDGVHRQDFDDTRAFAKDVEPPEAVTTVING